jgi:SIR2-like domain
MSHKVSQAFVELFIGIGEAHPAGKMIADNLPQIFDSKELDQNEARKHALIELIASGQALSLIGAGSSALIGYDTWQQLLKKLEELACQCGPDFEVDEQKRTSSPLEYAQDLRDYIAKNDINKYYDLICTLFRPLTPACDEFHKTLVQLPFKGIITTNYDAVLEAALGEMNPPSPHGWSLVVGSDASQHVSEFLLALDSGEFPRRVAHLHGIYYRPESIILSLEDYIRVYRLRPSEMGGRLQETAPSWSPHRKLLWALLATRRVVFIGFGMSDPLITGILNFVSSDLWRWDKSIHYAVMAITPQNAEWSKIRARELRRELGVEVVFYEDFDGSHLGLRRLVAEIYERCSVIDDTETVDAELKEPEKKVEAEPVTPPQEQVGQQASSDWLESVNRRMEVRIRADED